MDDFCAKVEEWWRGNEVNDKASFIIVHKLKAIKTAIKQWSREGRASAHKYFFEN